MEGHIERTPVSRKVASCAGVARCLSHCCCFGVSSPAIAADSGFRKFRQRWGAAGKRGQVVYTKIPYSACMNSFRIE
eukprot:COSAG02_NODE_10997_length_1814_cov_1.695044_3_plen_76_part_01